MKRPSPRALAGTVVTGAFAIAVRGVKIANVIRKGGKRD